ncbi:hypothetical protein CCP2SC5_1160011 [Azospirillaceae bacterium]
MIGCPLPVIRYSLSITDFVLPRPINEQKSQPLARISPSLPSAKRLNEEGASFCYILGSFDRLAQFLLCTLSKSFQM